MQMRSFRVAKNISPYDKGKCLIVLQMRRYFRVAKKRRSFRVLKEFFQLQVGKESSFFRVAKRSFRVAKETLFKSCKGIEIKLI